MLKTFCDTCNEEIKKGVLMAKFESLEPQTRALGGNHSTNPIVSEYIFCVPCKEQIKKKIVEMIKENE